MTVASDKAAVRKAALAQRKAAHGQSGGTSAGILSEVLAGYRGVPIAGYLPILSEIDPRPAMAEGVAHGPVGVPVIQGKDQPLFFANWVPEIALIRGPFGAFVPIDQVLMVPQIVIVPLVAFDRTGGRMGYGGGFYDRTLEGLRARGPVMAIGFAYGAQEVEKLPVEPTDQPLDLIVTERGVIDPVR